MSMEKLRKLPWLLFLVLAGCSPSSNANKAYFEKEVVAAYNEQLAEKGVPGRCVAVALVQDGDRPHHFVGTATFSDGSKKAVDVTIDADGKSMQIN